MPEANLSDLAPVVAVVFLFLAFLWKIGIKLVESLDKLTSSNNKIVASNEEITASNKQIASATTKGADEAKQRNGHLAEIQIESRNQLLEAIGKVNKQDVKEQVVVHQHVESDK